MAGLKKKFGRHLKKLRKQTDLTQAQLAEAVGISEESISNIERGIFGPSFDNLEKIASTMGVKVKTLFDFE